MFKVINYFINIALALALVTACGTDHAHESQIAGQAKAFSGFPSVRTRRGDNGQEKAPVRHRRSDYSDKVTQ